MYIKTDIIAQVNCTHNYNEYMSTEESALVFHFRISDEDGGDPTICDFGDT